MHLALATHLFNVFSPNIAPKISVPVASLGHFRFYGPSVEVNFTSLYLWVFMGLLEFSFTRSVPFLRAQQRQVFVARRRLPQRRWKPMWGNSDAGMVTKSIEFRRSQMSEMTI